MERHLAIHLFGITPVPLFEKHFLGNKIVRVIISLGMVSIYLFLFNYSVRKVMIKIR